MDDRQTQIREGAGLEESRVNHELISFLNKWSSPVIMVLAIAALAWAGLRYLEQRRLDRVDQAFGDLQDATSGGNPSPASLLALADEYEGVRSVSTLARLTTIDLYINAFIRGVEPGAEISQRTGEPVNESDALDEEQRATYLERAGTLTREIIDAVGDKQDDKAILLANAHFRAAAIAECERNTEGARASYERVRSLAESASFPSLARLAQDRLDALDQYTLDITLPSQDELAPLPGQSRAPGGQALPENVPPEILDQLEQMQRGEDAPEPGAAPEEGSATDAPSPSEPPSEPEPDGP